MVAEASVLATVVQPQEPESSMDGSGMAFFPWTIEQVQPRQYAYWDLDGEGRMIEDELSIRRGFLSVSDEIDFVVSNLDFGTTQSLLAKDSYTRRPPEEAHVGLFKQDFGRECSDAGCVDCVSTTANASDTRPAEASDDHTEATSHLCRICKHLNFEYLMRRVVGRQAVITLGYLDDVVARVDCAFCRLVAASIKTSFNDRDMPLEDANGRRTEIGLSSLGKDAHRNVLDLEIILHPWQRAHYHHILIHRSSSPADALPWCGRQIDSQTIDFTVVRAWLDACERGVEGTGHDGAVLPIEDDCVPSRLIDVDTCCVIRPGQNHYRYVTLSYVWGGPQPLCLLLSNERRLMASNGLLTSGQHLPQTIYDAMEVTRKLGERYLWIDALCIVQDDLEFKQAELLLMSKIYSQALLTIVATYGASVHAGLPGVSNVARHAPQHVEYVQDMALTNRLPTVSATVDESVWNSRAWTFQERVLANRKLYITKHQVMFICPHTEVELCEDVYGSAIRPSDNMWSWGRDGGADYRDVPLNPDGTIPSHCVNTAIYSSIVQQFCARQISFPADVLDAFTGIKDHLTILFESPFVMGLPVSELDTQLLWRNSGRIERRTCPDTGRTLFPSWSWAGWVGPCAGHNANANSFPAFQILDSSTDVWTAMDQLRGGTGDDTWRCLYASQCDFWQRGNEYAFYYAHPITRDADGPVILPALHMDEFNFAGILPIRTEVIKLTVTGATSRSALSRTTPLPGPDLPFHRALSLFDEIGTQAGTAFIPLSIAETLKPGSFDFVKIATVETGTIDVVDGFLDFKSCYDSSLYGFPWKDSWDRIDGLLVRTVKGVSYRLGVAVCHVNAFESANPKRTVVLLG